MMWYKNALIDNSRIIQRNLIMAELAQHATYGHLLPAAAALVRQHTDKTRAHLIATGAAMEALAGKFSANAATWKVAGLVHDLDWDRLDKDYERHCGDD